MHSILFLTLYITVILSLIHRGDGLINNRVLLQNAINIQNAISHHTRSLIFSNYATGIELLSKLFVFYVCMLLAGAKQNYVKIRLIKESVSSFTSI